MMQRTVVEELFDRLMEINQQAFQNKLFNTAYHALMAALHCAEDIASDEPLHLVSRIARYQLKSIDENYPEYEHSTRAARNRRMRESIFERAATQAETTLRMRELNARRGKVY